MARAATTTDVFNAIAESVRRDILHLLARGERAVNDIVQALGLTQPQVSKHLRVLRKVGLVAVRGDGRQRYYRLNPTPLRDVAEWVENYRQFWEQSFDRLDEYLHELQRKEHHGPDNPESSSRR
ncbi:MAG: winged helix-turn-helix transcriptional regulator [Phycisphaerales bacterium]|nr:winged helix-turn-helix transcriptional regulator [Phycisphaerales bacterium]